MQNRRDDANVMVENLERRGPAAQQGGPALAAGRGNAERVAQERDFAFNELIGLDGPFRLLWENALTVLITIWYQPVLSLSISKQKADILLLEQPLVVKYLFHSDWSFCSEQLLSLISLI